MAKLLAENKGITEILRKGKLAFFFFFSGKESFRKKKALGFGYKERLINVTI